MRANSVSQQSSSLEWADEGLTNVAILQAMLHIDFR